MRQAFLALLVAAGIPLHGPIPASAPTDASASELIALARSVTSGNDNYSRVKVRWCSKEGDAAGLAWYALYRAPDQFALSIEDAHDGRPLLFTADDRLLVYDGVKGVVIYIPDTRFDIACRFADGALHFSWAVRLADRGAARASTIVFDLASLFSQGGGRNEISRRDSRDLRLARTTDTGQSIIALVDPARQCPFRHISYRGDGQREPNFVIREICTGRDVTDEPPPFPSKDRLATALPLEDLSLAAERSDDGTWSSIAKAFVGRLAIADRGQRPEYERRFNAKINWDRVELTDSRVSRLLRELLPARDEPDKKRREGAGGDSRAD